MCVQVETKGAFRKEKGNEKKTVESRLQRSVRWEPEK
jgi:hypothetical protein